METSVRQMPPDVMEKEEWTTDGGAYDKDRVTGPIQSTVVRQESPAGPRYEEAIGYSFLLYSTKFPSVTRTGDERLVLNVSYEAGDGSRRWVLLYSTDDGLSWGGARVSPVGRSTLMSLGGQKLMAISVPHELAFSDDAGATWDGPGPAAQLPDGRPIYTDVTYNPLVEGNTVTFFAYSTVEPGYEHWRENQIWGEAYLRRYDVGKREWGDPCFLPGHWGLSEGSLLRTADGNLLAASRAQMIGTPILSDHWDGLVTLRSSDNGVTWSEPVHHFLYGYHHVSLLHLPAGRILMTYVARVGELDGRPYHGVEAVISSDNGATWDWEHRRILFRWLNSQVMHSPRSILRRDGTILTIFQHDSAFSCASESIPGSKERMMLGNVSAVIWQP